MRQIISQIKAEERICSEEIFQDPAQRDKKIGNMKGWLRDITDIVRLNVCLIGVSEELKENRTEVMCDKIVSENIPELTKEQIQRCLRILNRMNKKFTLTQKFLGKFQNIKVSRK